MTPSTFGLAGACQYEVVALISKKIPPISRLCARWPVLDWVVLIGLFWHFRKYRHEYRRRDA